MRYHVELTLATIKTESRYLGLVKLWRNWNPQTLLTEMENDAAAKENNLAVPQITKHRITPKTY